MRLPTILALAVLVAVCPRTSVRAQDDDDSYDASPDGGNYDDRPGDDGAPDEGDAPEPPGDRGGPPPDEDQYRTAPAPEDFDQALAPNGQWVDDPTYGHVWHPAVAVDWRPYSDGYWAWTPYGWTWISTEPWGWTFHYGHWVTAPVGWVWVPGTVWGPAYVDWVWHDGFIGWAPLPPVGHVVVVNNFVFVNETHFCDRRIRTVIERHPPRGWNQGDWHRYRVRGPDVHRVERVAREPVQRFQGKPRDSLAPSRRAGFNRAPGMRTPDGRQQRGGQNHPQRNQQDRPQGDHPNRPQGDHPNRRRDDVQAQPQHDHPDRPQHQQQPREPQRERQHRPQADPDQGAWRGGHPDNPPPQLRGGERQRREPSPQVQRPTGQPENFHAAPPPPRNMHQGGGGEGSGEGHERRGGGRHGGEVEHPGGGPQRRRQND